MAFVYQYLDDQGIVLYVGKTVNLQRRIAHHKRDLWSAIASEIHYIEGISKSDADILETFYINLLTPMYNKSKRWDKPSLLQLDRSYAWKSLVVQPDGRQPPKSAVILHALLVIKKNLNELEKKAGREG